MLRDMARHRGMTLLKSRRRKPGVGDFGKFGLADADGRSLLGVGPDGLTATAAEVAAYLRRGVAATWAESIEAVPIPAPRKDAVPEREREPERDAEPQGRSQPSVPPRRKPRRAPKPARRASSPPPARRAEPPPPPPLTPPPPPPPAPVLRIRAATMADAAALAALLPDLPVADRLRDVVDRLIVAERGGLVGCLAWQPVATLDRGRIARVTLVHVAATARREGVGRALVDAAIGAAAGCDALEIASEIAVRNANGFLRSAGFAQSGYFFVRPV